MTGRPQIAAAVLVLTIFLYLFAPVFVSGGTSDTSGGDSSTPQEKKKESTTLNLKQVFDPTTELPSLVRLMPPESVSDITNTQWVYSTSV